MDLGSFVRLAWNDMSSNELGFRVYRDGGLLVEVGPNVEGYDDSTVSAGNHVYYVLAYNASGESEHSNHVSILFGA
jgi:hypothetical protein